MASYYGDRANMVHLLELLLVESMTDECSMEVETIPSIPIT